MSWITATMSLGGCVSFPDAPDRLASPTLYGDRLRVTDGAVLALDVWPAAGGSPDMVFIAVHGMNDYAETFALAGAWWAQNANITTYAYDQRGFGRSPALLAKEAGGTQISRARGAEQGRWPGAPTLRADLRAAVTAVRARHGRTPVFVIGHSMGGAVLLSAMADATTGDAAHALDVDGVVLAAPAVWGGARLPLAYRISANLAASIAPGKTLTGERAGRQASDNLEILRAMGRDPYVIKQTRLDAVVGLVRLMGEAYDASDDVSGPALVLIGEKDEIIPVEAMAAASARLCGAVEVQRYPQGWHLLFRDHQAKQVWADVAHWARETVRRHKIGEVGAADPILGRVGSAAWACAS